MNSSLTRYGIETLESAVESDRIDYVSVVAEAV